jgi:hypothetical protein
MDYAGPGIKSGHKLESVIGEPSNLLEPLGN